MNRLLLRISPLLAMTIFAGCTITETGHAVFLESPGVGEICVVEDPAVNATFLPALAAALEKKGFTVKQLAAGTAPSACPLTVTYYGRWSWDFKNYLSHATLTVYRNGSPVGDALYDAPKAGSSMTTRIYESTESKVATMVENAFPRGPAPRQ